MLTESSPELFGLHILHVHTELVVPDVGEQF